MAEKVWIVEMMDVRSERWFPTLGISLTKDDAMLVKRHWQNRNPDDRFRVQKYERCDRKADNQ